MIQRELGPAGVSRDELYRFLGLEGLLNPKILPEDPRLREGKDTSLRTKSGFMGYFETRKGADSPFAGYHRLAFDLTGNLDEIADNCRSIGDRSQVRAMTKPVRLKPTRLPLAELTAIIPDRNQQMAYDERLAVAPRTLYDFEETSATRAFTEAVFALLQASAPQTRVQVDGTELTIYAGRYHEPEFGLRGEDTIVLLLETRGQDEAGGYRALDILTQLPELFS